MVTSIFNNKQIDIINILVGQTLDKVPDLRVRNKKEKKNYSTFESST